MGELKQHQPPMTIDEQVENLKNIGLIVEDEEYAKKILNDISYFRLIKAYSLNGALIYLFVLIIKVLRKYLKSSDVRKEKVGIKKSLGEKLKERRMRCKMTQEFVAESLGVSRQAVSKWENGASDPSTSNLFALAKLYGISVEELLQDIK